MCTVGSVAGISVFHVRLVYQSWTTGEAEAAVVSQQLRALTLEMVPGLCEAVALP